MDTSSFFRKSHAYIHVLLACYSTNLWPTSVLLPAATLWTSCECFGPGRTLSNSANYQFEGCSDMRMRNCSACMITMSIVRAQEEAVPSTRCLPNRNGGASCAPFFDAHSLFSKVSLPVGSGPLRRAAWCIYPTSTIHLSFSRGWRRMFHADRRFGVNRRGFASFTSFILALLNTTIVFCDIVPTLTSQVVMLSAAVALSLRCC